MSLGIIALILGVAALASIVLLSDNRETRTQWKRRDDDAKR